MSEEKQKDIIIERVLVTGAGGFIAGHIIKILLEKGYYVRGTVRNMENAKQRYKYLFDMSPNIELIQADLTKENNWDEAIKNCSYVIHTANPMVSRNASNAMNNNDDLFVQPALDGMKIILNYCLKYKDMIKRLVYTSSATAIQPDIVENNVKLLSTKNWTNVQLSKSAYDKSKTIAEKYAWDFMKQNNNPFEMVVINPGLTIGPLLNKEKELVSNALIHALLSGEFPLLPNCQFDLVDVRDVALAHVNALDINNNKINGNRYLLVNQSLWCKDISSIINYYIKQKNQIHHKNDYYPIPSKLAPNLFFQLAGLYDTSLVELVVNNLNVLHIIDNENTIKDLNIVFTRIDITLQDCTQSLIDHGLVKPLSKTRQVISSMCCC